MNEREGVFAQGKLLAQALAWVRSGHANGERVTINGEVIPPAPPPEVETMVRAALACEKVAIK